MSEKVCKKCGRPLPANYKYKDCESCRTEKVEKLKKGLKGAAGVVGPLVGVVTTIVSRGHFKPKGK